MIKIQENISLRDYTTFRVGGPARFFAVVRNVDEVREVAEWLGSDAAAAVRDEAGLPKIFVLGGGSNVLVADEGFSGLVLKVEIMGVDFFGQDGSENVKISVGAGENWDDFVKTTVERGLGGLENLSYIPGTVGGAPVQNIGAYGAEVASVIESVEAFDLIKKETRIFSAKECEFEYRNSFFKKNPGKFIITRVNFVLSKNPHINISYKDLQNYFADKFPEPEPSEEIRQLTPADVREAVIAIRTKKLPDWRVIGTVGSFFKNPIISISKYIELKTIYPDLPSYLAEGETGGVGSIKIPLAWILDNVCGFRGVQKGNVGTYKNQALVLINHGNATALEVRAFAQNVIDVVWNKTGIEVSLEAEYID